MSLVLAILLQVGPNPRGTPASPFPPELLDRTPRQVEAPLPQPDLPVKLQQCLEAVTVNPADGLVRADQWVGTATAADKPLALRCRGSALVALTRWDDAEAAFLASRESTRAGNHEARARLAAMAGNAALAKNANEQALRNFDLARTDAAAAGNKQLAGDIQVDRSRALVGLGRKDEAAMALDQARSESPQNAEAWLLSATLSRRNGNLALAQSQIEQALGRSPIDPEIGLEAGVIAVLSGRDNAARLSWESVVRIAPTTPAAEAATAYLAQLGAPNAEAQGAVIP
jgi:tetratricopeptide (TPR) repeat protein